MSSSKKKLFLQSSCIIMCSDAVNDNQCHYPYTSVQKNTQLTTINLFVFNVLFNIMNIAV